MLPYVLLRAIVGNSRIGDAIDEAYVPPLALFEEDLNETELC